MRQFRRALPVLAGMAVLLLGVPSAADADFFLRLETDEDVVTVGPSSPGLILYQGALGNFNVNVVTGISKPLLGGANFAELDLNSVNLSSSGGGTLRITLADTDFRLPSGNPLTLRTDVGGTLTPNPGGSGSVAFQSWVNPHNLSPLPDDCGTVIPAGSISAGPLGPFGGPAYHASASVDFDRGRGSYSMFSQAVFTFSPEGGIVSFDQVNRVTGVPEPGTLVLAVAGVPVLGLGYWLRRRGK